MDGPTILMRSYHAGSEGAALPKLWHDEQDLRQVGYVFRESAWQRDGVWEGMFADGVVRGLGRFVLAVFGLYLPTTGSLTATFARAEITVPEAMAAESVPTPRSVVGHVVDT